MAFLVPAASAQAMRSFNQTGSGTYDWNKS